MGLFEPKMKVKVVIFKKDRTNVSKSLSKQNKVDNKIRIGNNDYFITNKDHFCITRKWFRNYITYYFREDSPTPLPVPNFADMKRTGISTDELNALFEPYFLRLLAKNKDNKQQKVSFYLQIATLLVSGYGTYYLVAKLPDIIMKIVQAAVNGEASP